VVRLKPDHKLLRRSAWRRTLPMMPDGSRLVLRYPPASGRKHRWGPASAGP